MSEFAKAFEDPEGLVEKLDETGWSGSETEEPEEPDTEPDTESDEETDEETEEDTDAEPEEENEEEPEPEDKTEDKPDDLLKAANALGQRYLNDMQRLQADRRQPEQTSQPAQTTQEKSKFDPNVLSEKSRELYNEYGEVFGVVHELHDFLQGQYKQELQQRDHVLQALIQAESNRRQADQIATQKQMEMEFFDTVRQAHPDLDQIINDARKWSETQDDRIKALFNVYDPGAADLALSLYKKDMAAKHANEIDSQTKTKKKKQDDLLADTTPETPEKATKKRKPKLDSFTSGFNMEINDE